MGSIVFLIRGVSNTQDSLTHLSSFVGVTVNTSEKRFGVDIVDGNPCSVFSVIAGVLLLELEGSTSYIPVDGGKVLASERNRVLGVKTEDESVFTFSQILSSPVDDVVDLELIVRGADGHNLGRVRLRRSGCVSGFGDGFVVVEFTLSFSLFPLPILEPHFPTLFDCLSLGIVGPQFHLQLVTDHVGDHTVILTKELKVDNIRPVERIYRGLVFREQVGNVAD